MSVGCNGSMGVTGNCGKIATSHIHAKVQTVFYKIRFLWITLIQMKYSFFYQLRSWKMNERVHEPFHLVSCSWH
jgi:hypothetical protein